MNVCVDGREQRGRGKNGKGGKGKRKGGRGNPVNVAYPVSLDDPVGIETESLPLILNKNPIPAINTCCLKVFRI